MRHLRYVLLLSLLCVCGAIAATLQPSVEWRDKQPFLILRVADVAAVEGAAPMQVQVSVRQAGVDAPLWDQPVAVALDGEAAFRTELRLEMIKELNREHRLEIEVSGQAGIHHWESITITGSQSALQAFGLRRQGTFGNETVHLVVTLAGFTRNELPLVPCALSLRDRTDTMVMSRQVELTPASQPTTHVMEVTPKVAGSIGPYALEFSVENEDLGLYSSSVLRFGYANVSIPVTSFGRGDDSLWLAGTAEDPFRLRSLAYYYSRHLMPLKPSAYPVIAWDEQVAHSGTQSMRITYGDEPAHLFSRVELPGNPVWMTLWVKGNGSGDPLHVHFQDQINHTLAAWIRNANFSREFICNLNFTDWRQFRVPVLGRGLAIPSKKGSTENIDAPISLLSFSVVPPRRRADAPAEVREPIWLDSIAVETQAEPGHLLTLELSGNDANGLLSAGSVLNALIGNGSLKALDDLRLTLVARDADGQTLATERQDLKVESGAWAVATFALGEVAAMSPAGPIDIDVTATVPGQPALRTSQRYSWKSPRHAGIFRDFEEESVYNGYQPGQVIPAEWLSHVDGGVDGTRALAVEVSPEREFNSVVFHPVLPGIVSSVEVMIKGSGQAVTMQPWFIDSSFSGIWNLKYNLFWAEPVTVDWDGWRKVEIAAPPVPAWYGDGDRYFFKKPWYPLNLAFDFATAGEVSQILVDQIRVITHLPAKDEILAEIIYPDATRLHAPGQPLQMKLTSFAPDQRELAIRWRLENLQGFTAGEAERKVALQAGAVERLTLLDELQPGIYRLDIEGVGARPLQAYIQVFEASDFFGDSPVEFITSLPKMRETIGLTREKFYIDWDNTEPVPNLLHYNWIEVQAKNVSADGAYALSPTLGFSSDWAGPEAQDKIADRSYLRSFPNYLQIPVSTLNWSRFVREVLREYGARFDEYVFWENPDLNDAPQGIPPIRYRELLREVKRWVELYSPESKVVAGGFNYGRVLDYLEQVEEPHTLDFDAIAIQIALGDLSPEAGELEAFLDDLNSLLRLQESGRWVQPSELDWSIGEYVSPREQAGYHARASLILNSRGVGAHRFALINAGFAFDGFGVAYRIEYGNSEAVQTFEPHHVPKPSYFALRHVQSFLNEWQFQGKVSLPHRDLSRNRAFVYTHPDGRLATVIWSAVDQTHDYQRPASWAQVQGFDAFGVPLHDMARIQATSLPFYYEFPSGYDRHQLVHELRHLPSFDGRFPVVLDLHLTDEAAQQRAGYVAKGELASVEYSGRIPGAGKVREQHLTGLSEERFTFQMSEAGDAVLTRRWFFDGTGQVLTVQLNDGAAQRWDLSVGQDETTGVRASTWLLRGCVAGENHLTIVYETPGNCAGYRIEPLAEAYVDLASWGALHTRQTVGEMIAFRSAVGTPLTIGAQSFETGIGAHATSFIEYPINGHFERFEVTVGIDAYTEGRGSVEFRIFVDGREEANSGPVNGLSKAQTLSVGDLAGKQRIVLSVTNGGDGDQHDLANWVDGKLHLHQSPHE